MLTLGFALALLIGLSLGLLGGGGSTLTVPILVYVLGFGAKEAIATSLVVVGAVSVVGAVRHRGAGNLRLRVALGFGAVAMAAAFVGARLAAFVSGAVQLVLFALLMLAVAWRMLRGSRAAASPRTGGRGAGAETATAGGPGEGGRAADAGGGPFAGRRWRAARIVVAGAGVGLLTGLLGVGGGFLVVPALVLLAGLTMKEAVGTSLVVIALNCAAGFAGYLGQVDVDWTFSALFAGVAVAGILAGTHLVRFVSQRALRRAFAAFLILMGTFILYRNRNALVPAGGETAVDGRARAATIERAAGTTSVDARP